MKKILFILAFVYTAFSYGQGGPKVDAVKYKGDVTTTVRDLIDVPVGETWLVWNTTLSQFEYAGSDDVWNKLIVDGAQTTELFQVATQALNKIEVGIDGPTGGTDYVRISGGETSGQAPLLYITDNRLAVSNYDNTDIDAVGATSLITKAYGDANYGSGGVTDGDKGEIVVSGGVWSIDTNAVSFGNMADNSITEAEIIDGTVIEADLNISNTPTVNYALTSDGSTGFNWTNPSSFIGVGSILEDKLNIDNAPTNNYILAYNQPSLNFKWVDPATLGGGSSLPVDDTTSLVQDPVDNTKQLRFDVEDVNTSTTALFSVAGSNLFNATMGIRGGVLNDTSYFYNYLSDKTTVASKYGYDGTLNAVLMTNATSNDSIVLPDTGGIRMTDALTATSFIKDGATSDDILLGDGTTTSLAGLGVGDPDQTLSLGGTGNKDLTISGTGGNTIDLTGVDGVDADNIVSKGTARTSPVQYTDIYGQTQANYNTDGAPGAGELVIITDASPAEVVATATIAMDGWKMYDDQTADAATITLSDCDPGETLTVYINRASAPTLAGTGLTFNQLPNTTAFASATEMMIIFEVAYDGTTIDYYYVER